MKTNSTFFLSVAAFLMLLCSLSIFSRTATACPLEISMNGVFTAPPGGSQSNTVIITNDGVPGGATLNFTTGSNVFTVYPSQITVGYNEKATITITFTPGTSATGTMKGSLTVTGNCGKTFSLTGTVSASGVANSLPSDVSITITPNPATDHLTIATSGVRSAEIGIYDLLGKEIASAKSTTWKWNASGAVAGSYIVRIAGVSTSGEQFVASKRVIVSK
jgi:hypothetical protein